MRLSVSIKNREVIYNKEDPHPKGEDFFYKGVGG